MSKLATVMVAAALLAGCASADVSRSSPSALAGKHGPYRYEISVPGSVTSPRTSTPTPGTTSPDEDLGPVPPAARRFRWADADVENLPEAFTLTVLRGLSPAAALRAVVPRPDVAPGPVASVRRAIERANDRLANDDYNLVQFVAVARRGRFTLVLEDNGFRATDHRVTRRLSANGIATVLYTNVNANYSYLLARNGHLVREFDPLLEDARTRRPLPQERGLPFGREASLSWTNAMSLELTRRLTGYVVRPADFDVSTYALAAGTRA